MDVDTVGDAFGLDAGELLFHFRAHLDDVGTAGGGDQDTDGALSVVEHFIAGGIFVALFDPGNITETQLVVVVSLDEHVADVVHTVELVADVDPYAHVTMVEVTGIGGFVLSVEGGQHFGGLDAQIGHTVLEQGDVDAFGALAVEFHAFHAFDVVDFPFGQFGIVRQLAIVEAVAGKGIEHAVHIAEIVLNNGSAAPFGK